VRAETAELTHPRPELAPLTDAVRAAAAAHQRLAPRGAATWWPEAPPHVAPLSGAPSGVRRLDPADLVATVGAATPLPDLDAVLARAGTYVALDAPGAAGRTLGGVLAAGSAGPLAAALGPPRDQVLGLTFVAGNGAVISVGGRVVKNVAGFDLAKVVVGGFGGFGYIVEAHLRLRALPPADGTLAWTGRRAVIRDAAARALAAGLAPAALEAVAPGLASRIGLSGWALLVRALGSPEAVAAELDAARAALAGVAGAPAEAPSDAWRRWRLEAGAPAVVVRIGADPEAWDDALSLAETHLGEPAAASATVVRGTVRAGYAEADAARIGALRAAAARRGWPVTLERGGTTLRSAAGVWGAMEPRTLRLAETLRRAFDPNDVFAVPLWGAAGRDAPA